MQFVLQEAILVNCSRGPVVDEEALVQHLRENPMFRVGLDVFEVIQTANHFILFLWNVLLALGYHSTMTSCSTTVFKQDEPYMKPGLADMKNAVIVPHIASASKVKSPFSLSHFDKNP